MSYASQTALQGGGAPVVVRFELWGVPHKRTGINSGGSDGDGSTAYSVNPLALVSATPSVGYQSTGDTAGFLQVLQGAAPFGEEYDPTTGRVTFRGTSIRINDPGGDLADLFGLLQATAVGSLTSNVTRTATTNAIATGGSLTQGSAYFVGGECFVVSSATGVSPYDVKRGADAASETQRAHTASTDTAPYPDNIYDRRRLLRNLPIALYFGYDEAGFAKSSERGPYLFRLRKVTRTGDGLWQIEADPTITTLKRAAAFGAYAAALQPGWVTSTAPRTRLVLQRAGDWQQPIPSWGADDDYFTVAAGDEVLELRVVGTASNFTSALISRRAILGTDEEDIDASTDIREVLVCDPDAITSPRVGYVPEDSGYAIGDLVPTMHPFRIALALMLSRDGALANYETSGDNNYDVLKAPWGLDIAAERVDLDSWETAIEETGGAHFPRFALGMDGDFSVLDWMNEEALPFFPYTLHTTSAGRLALARTGDVYPFDTTVSIGAGDILSAVAYDMHGRQGYGRVSFEFKGDDGGKRKIIVASVLAKTIHREEVSTLKLTSKGASDRTWGWLHMRGMEIIHREESPQPMVRVKLRWGQHTAVTPGTVVALTHPILPDLAGGDYGVSAEQWRVTAVEKNPDPSDLSITATMMRGQPARKHIGPAGIVASWDGGTTTVTLEVNEFTPAAGLGDHVPSKDAACFGDDGSQGGLGYRVAFRNLDGSRWNDVEAIELVSRTGSAWELSAAPNVSSTPTDPSGTVMVLEPMTLAIAAAAGSTLHADVDDYLYQGADATPHALASGVNGNRYGA